MTTIGTVIWKFPTPAARIATSSLSPCIFERPITVPTKIAIGHVKSGRVRAIASTAPRRGMGALGDIPVMAETIPGFELVTWHGVMMSPATPRPLLERVNRELNAVLQRADVRERFANSGLEITGGAPEAFAAILRRDYDKYGAALRSAGVKPE